MGNISTKEPEFPSLGPEILENGRQYAQYMRQRFTSSRLPSRVVQESAKAGTNCKPRIQSQRIIQIIQIEQCAI
jgi:hypothetical protein